MGKRIERDRETVSRMVGIYCRDHHETTGGVELCDACENLQDYAWKRLERCPFGQKKPVCSECTVHCYRPEMRDRMRQVMGYAGPRMLRHHPVSALEHLVRKLRSRADARGPRGGDEEA